MVITMNNHTLLETGIVSLVFLVFIAFGWWLVLREARRFPHIVCLSKLLTLSHIFGGGCIIIYLALCIAVCDLPTLLLLFWDVEFIVRTGIGFLFCSMFVAIALFNRQMLYSKLR